jgi:hypothetical protein
MLLSIHDPKSKCFGVGIEAHVAPRTVPILSVAPRLRVKLLPFRTPARPHARTPARPHARTHEPTIASRNPS